VPAYRLAAIAALAVAIAGPFAAPAPAQAAATPIKVALIVGPMGSQTEWNRQHANELAAYATSMGATVAKAYSPNATYAKVRAAVAGANIIVYYGHGNGYPNPYGTKLYRDRSNGWGLNTTTTHGDQDSWANHTLVYCGEKALLGQLTATDGADQRKFCNAGAIAPAAGFVMVYVGSCYTAGGNEPQNPLASNADARAHVSYFSRPMFQLGASGYFAGHTTHIVQSLLSSPDTSYGDIFNANMPWDITASYETSHQLLSGLKVWLTRQSDTPYWDYAFAGNPARTFAGGTSTFTAPTGTADFFAPRVVARAPASGQSGVSRTTRVVVTFSENVKGATASYFTLWRGSTKLSATVSYNAAAFTATLTPASPLARGTVYTVKLTKTIRDLSNNRLATQSFKFKTAS
jgi:Big-like domain-containing protein